MEGGNRAGMGRQDSMEAGQGLCSLLLLLASLEAAGHRRVEGGVWYLCRWLATAHWSLKFPGLPVQKAASLRSLDQNCGSGSRTDAGDCESSRAGRGCSGCPRGHVAPSCHGGRAFKFTILGGLGPPSQYREAEPAPGSRSRCLSALALSRRGPLRS